MAPETRPQELRLGAPGATWPRSLTRPVPTPLQAGGRCLTNQLAASHAHLVSPADPQDLLSLSMPSGPKTRTRSSSCSGHERVPCSSRGLPRDRPEIRTRGTCGSKSKAKLQNLQSFMRRGRWETHTQPPPAGQPTTPTPAQCPCGWGALGGLCFQPWRVNWGDGSQGPGSVLTARMYRGLDDSHSHRHHAAALQSPSLSAHGPSPMRN